VTGDAAIATGAMRRSVAMDVLSAAPRRRARPTIPFVLNPMPSEPLVSPMAESGRTDRLPIVGACHAHLLASPRGGESGATLQQSALRPQLRQETPRRPGTDGATAS